MQARLRLHHAAGTAVRSVKSTATTRKREISAGSLTRTYALYLYNGHDFVTHDQPKAP